MKTLLAVAALAMSLILNVPQSSGESYTIVDTAQVRCYNERTEISYPKSGKAYFGQDAQYAGNQPSYRDNGDGTVSDLNTGLMWQADPGEKKIYAQILADLKTCRTGGYDDWRLPTTKELYSLILFSGTDPDPTASDTSKLRPFIDTDYFKFQYGKASDGDRIIDSQWATSTLYVGKVMQDRQAMFGVNFADGRIKGYPVDNNPRGGAKTFYAIYVRGNPEYGKNDFIDNGDGTVTDRATNLTWMKVDSAALKAGGNRDGKLDWKEALDWAENLEYAGHDDWRLPNAKELQSILNYTRSPDTTQSAAIDPIFDATAFKNEGGETDYGWYWSSTSHTNLTAADTGVYVAFGRALGYMSDPRIANGRKTLMDVHGAGAQRSDPKRGDPSRFPTGRGPQGDVIRIYNLVRCVRGGVAEPRAKGPKVEMKSTVRRSVVSGSLLGGNARQPSKEEDFIRRLDRNNDGKVSRQEFDGPKERFSDFDRNGDGYIDTDEAPTGPPQANRPSSRP